jgi:2-polyprenyl-3-methyl-5-hydroxy-6-metoxy-1,4-benzoquinol methylase
MAPPKWGHLCRDQAEGRGTAVPRSFQCGPRKPALSRPDFDDGHSRESAATEVTGDLLAKAQVKMDELRRDSACWQMASDKRWFGLPLQDVRRIDSYLRDRWGITPPVHPNHWQTRLRKLAGKRLYEEYSDLHDEQAAYFANDESPPDKIERAFYDVMADPRISSHVHSQKRTEILDAGCLLVHLVRSLQVKGPVLDVGCHIGYHSALLAKECGVAVHGIDHSHKAISVAAGKAVGEPLLSFSSDGLEAEAFQEHFEMVFAVRSIDCDSDSVTAIAKTLRPGGIVIFLPHDVPDLDTELSATLQQVGLGWGFSDVVGGLVGEGRGFEAGIVLGLVKDGTAPVPSDFVEQAQSAWGLHFREYANAASTANDEKTQAFCRGYLQRML